MTPFQQSASGKKEKEKEGKKKRLLEE